MESPAICITNSVASCAMACDSDCCVMLRLPPCIRTSVRIQYTVGRRTISAFGDVIFRQDDSKSAPRVSSTTLTVPPCNWAAQRAMDRPRPVPPDSVPGPVLPLTKRRKMSKRSEGAIWEPKFTTLVTMVPWFSSSWASTSTVVPSAECFSALAMMLVIAGAGGPDRLPS